MGTEVFPAQCDRTGRDDGIHSRVVVSDQGSTPLNRRLGYFLVDHSFGSASFAPRKCRLDRHDSLSVCYSESPPLAILIVFPRGAVEDSGDLPRVGAIVVLIEDRTLQLLSHHDEQ